MANLSNINNILRTSSLGVGINCDAEFSLDIEKASANAILSLNSNGGSGAEYLLSSTTSGEFVLNKRYVGDRLTISSGGDATFAGNVLLNGYLSVEGTTGNTGGATDRWIGGDGTAGTWFYNVPTGSSHLFGINNSNVLTLNGTGATFAGSVSIDANSGILTQEILKVKGGGSGGAYGFLVEANNGDDLFKVDTSTYNCYFPSSFTKVGINASDPVKTLDVRGQLAISNSASSYWYMDRNDATGNFEILTDTNSSVFNIDTSGKVIINDNTIGDKLLLAGDNAGTARGLMFNCSTTTNQGDTWDIDAQSSTGIIKFSTTSTERMRIDSYGRTKITTVASGNTKDT